MQGYCDGEGSRTEADADEVVRLGIRGWRIRDHCAVGLHILVEGIVGGAIDLVGVFTAHRHGRCGAES